jgi:hypothetical protein
LKRIEKEKHGGRDTPANRKKLNSLRLERGGKWNQ